MSGWPFAFVSAVTKTATASSVNYALPGGLRNEEKIVRLARQSGGGRVWIEFVYNSTDAVTSATGMELIPGVVEDVAVARNLNNFAIICDTGTVDVNVTVGRVQ